MIRFTELNAQPPAVMSWVALNGNRNSVHELLNHTMHKIHEKFTGTQLHGTWGNLQMSATCMLIG